MNINRTNYVATRNPVGHGYDLRPLGMTPSGVIIHTTTERRGGSLEDEAARLSTRPDVSAHYLISKRGEVFLLLPDVFRAWHAGRALERWSNARTIGIVAHVASGEQWAAAQRDAVTELVQGLMADYGIPGDRIATHRAVSLPAGRVAPLAGWSEASFNRWRASLRPGIPRSQAWAMTLLSPPRATLDQVWAQFAWRPNQAYTAHDLRHVILPAYWEQAISVGLDPVLAIMQGAHETGDWTSFWSRRPQRNPAGIGVNGECWDIDPGEPETVRWNVDRRRWERGLSFASWVDAAIPAHLGRLLAYALPYGAGTAAQRAMIDRALTIRPLPSHARGSAPVVAALGRVLNPVGVGWASPGDRYGEIIAERVARAARQE